MRLFIALPVTGAGKALQSTQTALQRSGVRGRFAPPENLHITLAFLGEADDPAAVTGVLGRVPVPQTTLRFDRLTLFGDVLVALVKPDEALETCVRQLRQALDEAGIRYDKKAFRPHVTLARKTALPGGFRLAPMERGLREAGIRVTQLRLYKSDTSGETAKYTVLYTKEGKKRT